MPDEPILSGREIEILQLVARGLSNREIAQALSISLNTVKVHLSNIFTKIGVSSRTEATLYGIEHRLVTVPGVPSTETPPASSWRDGLRQYAWIGVALGLLLVMALVTFGANTLFPPRNAIREAVDVTDRWVVQAAIPVANSGMAAVTYEGDIFAIGGEGDQGVSGAIYRYASDGGSWERLVEKPTPTAEIRAVVVGGKVYIPGGRVSDGRPTSMLEIYDPRQNVWTQGARLPYAVSAYALAAYEGRVYLFGGWDGQQTLDGVLIYDPVADNWTAGSPMSAPRRDASAAETDGKIYVVGGEDEGQVLYLNQSYQPQREGTGESPWRDEVALPETLTVLGVQEIAEFIFLIGANDIGETVILHLNTQSGTWNEAVNPADRQVYSGAGLTALGSDLVILGGKTPEGEFMNDHLHYRAVFTVSIPIINQ